MDEMDIEKELFYSFFVFIVLAIILVGMAFKLRDVQDRVERLEQQIVTEQSLEQPTTETTTEMTTESHIEPSDDEIVMSIRGED